MTERTAYKPSERMAYRLSEVCQMLGVDKQQVHRWAKEGKAEIVALGSTKLVKFKTQQVYFIRGGDYIKIGFAWSPERRLLELRTGAPFPLQLMHSIPGGYKMEEALHARFAHLRTHGEWFHAAPELTTYIAGLP